MERVAYTPKEFAALFGKSQTWGYRQIYSGAVASTKEHGRTLIPAREVEKILGTAKTRGPNAAKPTSTHEVKNLRSVLISGTKRTGSIQRRSGKAPGR